MAFFRTAGLTLVSPEGFPSGPADLVDLLAEAGDALAHHLNAHSTPEEWQDSPEMDLVEPWRSCWRRPAGSGPPACWRRWIALTR